jgi:hypothetical protein
MDDFQNEECLPLSKLIDLFKDGPLNMIAELKPIQSQEGNVEDSGKPPLFQFQVSDLILDGD